MKLIPPLNAATGSKVIVILGALALYEFLVGPTINRYKN